MNLKGVSVYAIGGIIAAFLSFITLPILAWTFSQADVGRIVMLQVSCSLVVVVASLGLDQAFVREYNEGLDQAALAKACLYPGFIVLAIFIIFAGFYYEQLTKFLFGASSVPVFVVVIVSLIVLYLERFFSVFIRMKELALPYAFTRVAPKLMFLVLIIWISFSSFEKSFLLLSIVQMACWLTAVLIALVLMLKFLMSAVQAEYLKDKQKMLLAFGLPLVASGVAFWGLAYIDRIMLGYYSSFSEVGLYSVASSFAGIALLFQQIFSTIWHPLLYKWSASAEVEQEKFNKIGDAVQLFSFLLISFAGLFSWLLPYFLPKDYELVQYIFISCLIYPLFIVISEVNGAGVSLMRKTIYLPFITAIALVINFFLNMLLVPKFGASGAAAATAVSIFIFSCIKLEVSNRIWRFMPRFKLYAVGGGMVVACVIYSLFGELFSPLTVLFWGAAIPVLLALYRDSSVQFFNYVLRR